MTILTFSNAPETRHSVRHRADGVQVDDRPLSVQDLGAGDFATRVAGRSERLHAVAHGDAIYVQLKGRAWRIDRVDPTRSRSAGGATATGASVAPMPGVVVSVHTQVGATVRQGDALLVIESMKLQMTIGAATDGVVAELPFAVGQTFQRGATLVRTTATEAHA